jgi:PAS domain-containing protein
LREQTQLYLDIVDGKIRQQDADALHFRGLPDREVREAVWRRLEGLASVERPLTDMAVSCGNARDIRERSAAFYLPPPLCSAGVGSRTFQVTPQQVADALGRLGTAESARLAPETLRQRDFRVRAAQRHAAVFDVVIDALADQLYASMSSTKNNDESDAATSGRKSNEEPVIAAAYFISVDSVIRYWTRAGSVGPGTLPGHRLWAARPYFETLLQSMRFDEPIRTRAYMDFAGHGIVYTECSGLMASAREYPAPVTSDLVRTRVGVGAVCVDYALTDEGVAQLVDAVNRGPVADSMRVTFSRASGGNWQLKREELPLWAAASDLEQELDHAAIQFSTNPANRRDILALGSGEDESAAFLIPTRVRDDGNLDAIAVRVSGIGPLGSRPVAMMVATIFGALSLGALLAGFRGSRAVAKRERLLGRLRSLQVAVLQTDGHERITAANDLAEDLVGRMLPTFGLEAARLPNFWDIFDRRSIHEVDLASGPDDELGFSVVKGDEFAIRDARERGETTSYYVRLRMPRTIDEPHLRLSPRWLRITAGPILRPRPAHTLLRRIMQLGQIQDDAQATFGVMEPVPDVLGQKLDSKMNTSR